MTTPDLASCIVPVYNGEQFLGEALDSIIAQSYRPLEILVIDDGSTDGTAAVARGYGPTVLFRQQANAGPAAARNHGLELARGEFVAFLDADDLWHPEKLTRQVARLRARPGLGAVTGHFQYFWAADLREEAERFRDHPLARPLPSYLLQTLVARRSVFDRVGPLDPALQLGEDTEWIMRAWDHGVVMETLPDTVTYRRVHRDSLTRRQASAIQDEFFRLAKMHLVRRRRLARADSASLAAPGGP